LCIYTAELVSKPKRLKFTASLAFLAFLEIFGFHVAYIGGTYSYRVHKSDLDDSVEGTKNHVAIRGRGGGGVSYVLDPRGRKILDQ
jgi:hypothetical protein